MSEYIWAFLRAVRRLCSLCDRQERGPHPSSSPGRVLRDPSRSLYKSGPQYLGGTRKRLLSSAANGLGAVAPGGVLLLLDPLPQLVPARRQVPAGVQEALEGRPGSGVAEVVLCQLDPLLLQGVVPEIGRASCRGSVQPAAAT